MIRIKIARLTFKLPKDFKWTWWQFTVSIGTLILVLRVDLEILLQFLTRLL